jgi:hypothetical protein
MLPQDQLQEVAALHSGAAIAQEAEITFVLLPGVPLPEGVTPTSADLLLCPVERDGYPCRVFFGCPIQGGPSLNWHVQGARILERAWWAFSWRVPPGLRLAQMVEAHLQALRRGGR